jgi:predicted dehydrogenase
LAQCWFESDRPSIGKGQEAPPPAGLDYDLWQGPAPRRPFRDNYLHYNWHWFWEWGNGELGNNGIHFLDICRWGLGVDYPIRVSSAGGRYRFEDDQETPDTQTALYDFEGGKSISWDGLSCNRRPEGKKFDIVFHGENGSLAMSGAGYTVFDDKGKEVRTASGSGGDGNVPNFLAAIRQTAQLTSEIEEAHKSTLICHLGNIAYRTKRTLHCDPANGHIQDDAAAIALWTREYEPGWEPKIS